MIKTSTLMALIAGLAMNFVAIATSESIATFTIGAISYLLLSYSYSRISTVGPVKSQIQDLYIANVLDSLESAIEISEHSETEYKYKYSELKKQVETLKKQLRNESSN